MTDEEMRNYEQELKNRMIIQEFKCSDQYHVVFFQVMKLSDGVYFKWFTTKPGGTGPVYKEYLDIVIER